mgnify:CR=1 FL=1
MVKIRFNDEPTDEIKKLQFSVKNGFKLNVNKFEIHRGAIYLFSGKIESHGKEKKVVVFKNHCICGIYISHQHADHSFGLPALLLWMRLMGRKRALKIMGGPGLEGWLKRLLDLAYPGSFAPEKTFPIQVEVIQPNQIYSWGDTEFHTAVSRHSVRNCSLRIHANTGVVCYSGDGAPSAETEALFQGSDLLVHECYSDATPMDTHASAEYLIPMAERLGIASLYLLHLGVEYKDDVVRRVGSWTGNTRVHLPFPGQKVDLGQDTGFDPS